MITFRVVPDNGEPYEVEAGARDVLTWERMTHGAAFSNLRRQQNMSDLYRLAYLASRRLGKFGGTEKDFEQTCEIEPIGDDEDREPDPTRPAP